jgi:hypothetical protein
MPKTRYTLLVEFDGDPPSVAANQPILGGSLVAVSFQDEFAEQEKTAAALHQLAHRLRNDARVVESVVKRGGPVAHRAELIRRRAWRLDNIARGRL